MTESVEKAVADAFRREWGRIVATLIRLSGDWDLAEECAQDAFARALQRWPRDGIPERPGAWLTTTARNRALDRLRRTATESAKLEELMRITPAGEPAAVTDDSAVPDDRLRLIFTCCHPALAPEARVALTLRTLAGLTTAELARAFLVPEPTMAKRLVRAKQKIRNAAIPYRVPAAHLLPERSGAVLAVLYLLFNEGYSATSGANVVRWALCDEAIQLARVLRSLLPDEPEVGGLLALMLFHDARRSTRVDDAGIPVPLEDQDRSRWDAVRIAEAARILGPVDEFAGAYRIQAAIAACHATAATAADTDWSTIARLYQWLAAKLPSPVVELNRAVAVAMADGPNAGLTLVLELAAAGQLADYYLLPATEADLLRRSGRSVEAAEAYRRAMALVSNDADRAFLRRRLAEVGGGPLATPGAPVV